VILGWLRDLTRLDPPVTWRCDLCRAEDGQPHLGWCDQTGTARNPDTAPEQP
jgi:hypothetical protein